MRLFIIIIYEINLLTFFKPKTSTNFIHNISSLKYIVFVIEAIIVKNMRIL